VPSPGVASAVVPTSLVSAAIKAATLFGAGNTAAAGGLTAEVAALTGGGLKAMALNKIKSGTVVVLLVAAGGLGGGLAPCWTGAARKGDQPLCRQGQEVGVPGEDKQAPAEGVPREEGTANHQPFYVGGFRSNRGFAFRGVGPDVNRCEVGGDFLFLN